VKIAQICPYNFFRPGGVQFHIDNLARELRLQGHEVKIIAPKVRGIKNTREDVILLGRSAELSINRTQIEMSIVTGQESKDAISNLLKEENFDILHFHEPWAPALSMQILSLSEATNVATFHAASPKTVVARSIETLFLPIAKYVVNTLDGLIAVSSVPTEFIREFYKRKIHIVPNGIDLEIFNPRNKPFKKYQDGKVNIFFVGRLDKRKGVKYLVKAFRRLKGRFENVRLIIGGKGDELKKIKKYIKKFDLRDVEILGFVEEEDKPRYFTTCDIFCSPALYGESFGIVLVEAMASGKPVVACSNPGYKTVLSGRGSLLLCEPKDTEELAQKLEILCKDRELRRFMGEWGLKEAQKYSWPRICKQVLAVYKSVKETKRKKDRIKASKRSIREILANWFKDSNGF
jgi:phosphatidylinositol alpha-mannosyltransferase